EQGNGAEGLRQTFATVTGHERKGDPASRQRRRDVVDRPAVQIPIEQRRIQRLAFNDGEGLARRTRRRGHFGARLLQAGGEIEGNEWFVLDHEEALSFKLAA